MFVVREAVPPQLLSLDIRLPFGVTNDDWRGRFIEAALGRLFVSGPAEALARLKRASERG
jgi:hypothetical protein